MICDKVILQLQKIEYNLPEICGKNLKLLHLPSLRLQAVLDILQQPENYETDENIFLNKRKQIILL